jgi:sugar O-acyltransferase (sialic acid O-acetyltransferase NeuD family)
MSKLKPVLLMGLGGHAKVLINILRLREREIIGALSLDPVGSEVMGINVLGPDKDIEKFKPSDVELVNAVGQLPESDIRMRIYINAKNYGFTFVNVIHPNSIIAESVNFGEGVQVMAGAIIEPAVEIGDNSIVNTGANINHDTVIGKHSHLAPGVVVCGNVHIGNNSFIGASSSVMPGAIIDDNAFIKAKALVKNDKKSILI